MGEFSMELCGGTHVESTGDIGLFKIVSESGIAAGVRRIEALSGVKALEFVQAQELQVSKIAGLLKTDPEGLSVRIEQMLERTKATEKELDKLKQQLAANAGADVLSQVIEINGIKVLSTELKDVEAKSLRAMVDDFKNQLSSAIIVLGVADTDKVSLIGGVTKDLVGKVKAGDLVNFVALQVGGKGGGRPDMAQAGGSQPENLVTALASVEAWLVDKL
jgi:alanyl-tRNA synthetase